MRKLELVLADRKAKKKANLNLWECQSQFMASLITKLAWEQNIVLFFTLLCIHFIVWVVKVDIFSILVLLVKYCRLVWIVLGNWNILNSLFHYSLNFNFKLKGTKRTCPKLINHSLRFKFTSLILHRKFLMVK